MLETIFGCKFENSVTTSNDNSMTYPFNLTNTYLENEENTEYNKKLILINTDLNEDQQRCVQSAMLNRDFFIIHGPPGTGKTSTLVEIILQNLERKKKILVVSPSNVAIDTIAERLLTYIDTDSDLVCRIGHPTRLLEEVKRIAVDNILGEKMKDIMEKISKSTTKKEKNEHVNIMKARREEEMLKLFQKCNVFMATTVSSGSQDLENYLGTYNTYFDLIMIDECAQAKESECFIPILQGRK